MLYTTLFDNPIKLLNFVKERRLEFLKHLNVLKKAEPVPPPDDAPVKEKMAFRLKTQAGRTVYKKRKETVEPVFGIIKTILGFRGFLLRGLDKVSIEWDLITAAYNFKRLHKLCGGNLLEFTKILPQRS